jgi:transcriptional regulator with XRE-family HTH domain
MERREALPETAIMCFQQDRHAMSTADALRSAGQVDSASENEIQMLIGANLKRLRKQRGFSRRQLAHLAQVERSALRHLERGAMTPSVGMLWKLARELHVPCIAFIESEPHRTGFDNLRGRPAWLAIGAAVSSAWRQNRHDPAANAAH